MYLIRHLEADIIIDIDQTVYNLAEIQVDKCEYSR